MKRALHNRMVKFINRGLQRGFYQWKMERDDAAVVSARFEQALGRASRVSHQVSSPDIVRPTLGDSRLCAAGNRLI